MLTHPFYAPRPRKSRRPAKSTSPATVSDDSDGDATATPRRVRARVSPVNCFACGGNLYRLSNRRAPTMCLINSRYFVIIRAPRTHSHRPALTHTIRVIAFSHRPTVPTFTPQHRNRRPAPATATRRRPTAVSAAVIKISRSSPHTTEHHPSATPTLITCTGPARPIPIARRYASYIYRRPRSSSSFAQWLFDFHIHTRAHDTRNITEHIIIITIILYGARLEVNKVAVSFFDRRAAYYMLQAERLDPVIRALLCACACDIILLLLYAFARRG